MTAPHRDQIARDQIEDLGLVLDDFTPDMRQPTAQPELPIRPITEDWQCKYLRPRPLPERSTGSPFTFSSNRC